MSTDTPRVDARLDDTKLQSIVSADFARELERELNAANAKIAEITTERDDLKHDIERHLRICTELESRLAAIDAQPVVGWVSDDVLAALKQGFPGVFIPADDGPDETMHIALKVAKPASNPDSAQEKKDV